MERILILIGGLAAILIPLCVFVWFGIMPVVGLLWLMGRIV